MLTRLAGTGWDASVSTLRASSLALVYSTAEYCSLAWSKSRNTKEVDVAINSAMRTITVFLKPTPTQNLPILAGIGPALARRTAATFRLTLKYALTEHFNNNLVRLKTRPRLESRRPFALSAIDLVESFAAHESIAQWTQHLWVQQWKKSGVPPHSLRHPKWETPDLGLSRSAWRKLNRLRMRVGSFQESLHRWMMALDPWYPCGYGEAQNAEHIINRRCASSGCLERMQILVHPHRLRAPG